MKISVVTVCYNAVKTIEETILSVVDQTYDNVEYIIIDGSSTDGTVDIIKKYAPGGSEYGKHHHAITYWVSEPDKGMYDALKKGFERCTGDIMCWINADDFYYKSAFSTVADFFGQNPTIKWMRGYNVSYNEYSQIVYVATPIAVSKRLLEKGFYQPKYRLPFIQQESVFWRKDLMKNVDIDKFSDFKLAGDYYLWFSFVKYASLHSIPSYLGGWRRVKGQLSGNMDKYVEEIESFILKKLPYDFLIAGIYKIIHYCFKGSTIYRKIYKNSYHYWSSVHNRFI